MGSVYCSMGRKSAIGAAIERAYRAAGEPEEWEGLCASLCEALAAEKIGLLGHNFDTRCGRIVYAAGFAETFRSSYAARYAARNVWLASERPFAQKRVMTGDEVIPYWELTRSVFYEEWLRPQDCYHTIFGVVRRIAPELLVLAAHRPLHAPPFAAADKRIVGGILPHLERAIAVEARFMRQSSASAAVLELLGHLPEAAFLIDHKARLRASNPAGDELLARRDGLVLAQCTLACARAREHQALRRLIAATTATVGPRLPGGRLVVTRPSGRPPLLISVLAMAHPLLGAFGTPEPVAAVVTKDPERAAQFSARELNALYSMTGAEARLALLIHHGLTLQDAAQTLHITKNTARTHMKAVYAKTGVHRQADLVRLLD
jgi:DNA-binding CsgD family transcriptional regulator